jgi:hypothetical protein
LRPGRIPHPLPPALLCAALLAWAPPAHAFDYTYVEGGTAYANGDTPNRDGSGPWFGLSAAVGPAAHLFADYVRLDLRDKDGGAAGPVDETGLDVGLGVHAAAAAGLDLVLRGAYEQVRTDPAVGPETTRSGPAVQVGVRLRLRRTASGTQVVNLGVTFRDLDDRGDTVARAGVVVPLVRHLAVTGDVRDEGDRWQARAGLRVAF